MPSIARTLGLILVVGGLLHAAAEGLAQDEWSYGQPDVRFATHTAPATGRTGNGSMSPGFTGGSPSPDSARQSMQTLGPVPNRTPMDPTFQRASQPVPLTRPGPKSLLPLKSRDLPGQAKRDRSGGLPSVVTVAGSLAVVLGIFFLVAWGMRRTAPPGSALLPDEVFEVLGRSSMANRQQVHLLRCGNKLVLVSVTPEGAETLTEITDPFEVDRLSGLCHQARPNSATAAFRQVFGQFSTQRSAGGFFGKNERNDAGLSDVELSAGRDV